jgi:hypothetical protein
MAILIFYYHIYCSSFTPIVENQIEKILFFRLYQGRPGALLLVGLLPYIKTLG